MAVFTNAKDKDLPILTQVYQASTDPPYDEVKFLYERWKEPGDKILEDEDFHSLAVAFNLLREMMNHLVAGPTVRGWLGKRTAAFLKQHWRGVGYDLSQEDADGNLPISAFHETIGGYSFSVLAKLADEMHSLIIYSKREYQSTGSQTILARCEECTNIFMPLRKASYCSHRCADRVSARRQKKRLKESAEVASIGYNKSEFGVICS